MWSKGDRERSLAATVRNAWLSSAGCLEASEVGVGLCSMRTQVVIGGGADTYAD